MNKRNFGLALLAGLSMGITASANAEEVTGKTVQEFTLAPFILNYLMQDCGTGDPKPRGLLDLVIERQEVALPGLRRVLRYGPPARIRNELQQLAESDYRSMRNFLDEGGLEGLEGTEVRKDARALDRDRYIEMRVGDFVQASRERALNAIVAIGDRESIADMEAVLKQQDIDDGFRQAVARGIETIESIEKEQ